MIEKEAKKIEKVKIKCESKKAPTCRRQLELFETEIDKRKLLNKGKFFCDDCHNYKEKKYFKVVMECNMPATVTYKVLAESPEKALELIKNMPPIAVKYYLPKKINLKATIYEFGSSLIQLIKKLR